MEIKLYKKCEMCEASIPLDGKYHEHNGVSSVCDLQKTIKPIDEMVGIKQQVYQTNYTYNKFPEYIVFCFKCGKPVKTTAMYVDDDGSQRHSYCLERKI